MYSSVFVTDLIDMVQLEVAQQQQQQSRDGFHNDLLVSVYVNTQPHRMKHRRTTIYHSRQLGQRHHFKANSAFYPTWDGKRVIAKE